MSEAELYESMLDRIETLARATETLRQEKMELWDERMRLARKVDSLTGERDRLASTLFTRNDDISKLTSRVIQLEAEKAALEMRCATSNVQPIRSGQ